MILLMLEDNSGAVVMIMMKVFTIMIMVIAVMNIVLSVSYRVEAS